MNKIVVKIDFHHYDFWLIRLFFAYRIDFQSDKLNFLTNIK